MAMRRSTLLSVVTASVVGAAGCGPQDTECLSGIGRKILDRAGSATASCRQKLGGWKNFRLGIDSIEERVSLRLRWEKLLADVPIEVIVQDKDVELKGTVKTVEQRARAVEIAESTAGVQRVQVSLNMADEKREE